MSVAAIEPRIARTREVVFAAAIEIVAEQGFAGASIDAIAQRAGVARSTIYRNWPGRTELLLEAVGSVVGQVESLAKGELRGDLVAIVSHLAALLASDVTGSVAAAIVLESRHDTELEELRRQFVAGRRRALDAVIGDAVARGDLPPGTDVERLGEELAAMVMFRALIVRAPIDADWVEGLVDRCLQRFGAGTAGASGA